MWDNYGEAKDKSDKTFFTDSQLPAVMAGSSFLGIVLQTRLSGEETNRHGLF